MTTISKRFDTLKQAEGYQNKLYEQYNSVQLIQAPTFSEEGLYIWRVDGRLNTMRAIKVTFDDGEELTTNINGTNEEIRKYYIGQWFNRGSGSEDKMTKAVSVEFLD